MLGLLPLLVGLDSVPHITGRHLFGVSFSLYMQLFDYILKLHKCKTRITVFVHFKCTLFLQSISCGCYCSEHLALSRDEHKTRSDVLYQELLFYSSREL